MGEKINAEGVKTDAASFACSDANAKYYDENGNQVTTLEVGKWYKAVLTPSSGDTTGNLIKIYTMGNYPTPCDGGQTIMAIAFRNIQVT